MTISEKAPLEKFIFSIDFKLYESFSSKIVKGFEFILNFFKFVKCYIALKTLKLLK